MSRYFPSKRAMQSTPDQHLQINFSLVVRYDTTLVDPGHLGLNLL
jgi:hypothetical protein